MAIKIVLRETDQISRFRRLLLRLISCQQGDSIIICSGYIWQPDNGSYNILDDQLLTTIISNRSLRSITTIAGKLAYKKYMVFYKNFVSRLRRTSLNVTGFYTNRKNWHAKVAILLNQNEPIAALIGSSNLTRPAYGEHFSNWNYECDVLIWKESPELNHCFQDINMGNNNLGVISAIFSPDIEQPSEEEQLRNIYDDIMNESESFSIIE